MTKRSIPLLACLALGVVPRAVQAQPVGREFRVNTYSTDQQSSPSISSDANGTFVVAWRSYDFSDGQDGSQSGVFGQRYDGRAGRRLGGEFQINTYTTGNQQSPSVSSAPGGNFVVVWESDGQDGNNWGLFGQRYAGDGSALGDEFQVNTYTTGIQRRSSLASDADGNFVVVWSGAGNGDPYGTFGQRYDRDGIRLGREFRVNTYTTGSQVWPKVAMDPEGNFVVVWASEDQDRSNYGVFGRRFDSAGVPLGNEFQINTHTRSQRFPSVAFDGRGLFVVVWEDDYSVAAQRYDADGSRLGGAFKVNTEFPDDSNYDPPIPNVAAARDGAFIVVWNHSLGLQGHFQRSKILGRQYDHDGNPLGEPIKVNEMDVQTFATEARIAGTGSRFVVVWTGLPFGSFNYDVAGRRLATP